MRSYHLVYFSVALILTTTSFASEQTLNPSCLEGDVGFGQSFAGVGDVNGDSVPDLATSGNASQGQAFVFSGANGLLLYTLENPNPQANRDFGCSLAGVGDRDGDTVPDIAVGSHPQDQGETFLFSGIDGAFLYGVEDFDSQAEIDSDCSLAKIENMNGETVIGDVNSDSVPDIAVAGDSTQGQAFVFSGTDGSLLYMLENPNPQTATSVSCLASTEEMAKQKPLSATETHSLAVTTRAVNRINNNLEFGGSTNKVVSCLIREKYIKKGKWRTLESFWNAGGTAFFKAPVGARIKVRYGVGWFGKDRQKQTLNGVDYKKLNVGKWSVTYARMQMKVSESTYVTYAFCPGGIGTDFPPIRF